MAGRGRFKNITGQRFNRLVVDRYIYSKNGKAFWKCKCDCGNYIVTATNHLKSSNTKSCGCLKGTHRMSNTPTYISWNNMINRCTQPSSPAFKHYKKRGISVCDRWRDFSNFMADMGERPTGATLDRWPDNEGDYEPGNVRWATKRQQANNRVTNKVFSFKGKKFTLIELSRFTGVSMELIRSRLLRSSLPWTVEGAVKTPKLTRRNQGFYC